MPFNGSGTFVKSVNWATEAVSPPVSISNLDDSEQDIADGLSNCITKDGQTTVTADIPFNDKKLTGIGNATNDADALNRVTADGRYSRNTTIAARKNSTTLRANTTTFADDPDLVAALATGSFYGFEFVLSCNPNVGGIKFRVDYSGTKTTNQSYYFGSGLLDVSAALYGTKEISNTGDSINAAQGNSNNWIVIRGFITTTSTGNLSLTWAQNTSSASSTSLFQGSYLLITKL